jgi:hypothetical protein
MAFFKDDPGLQAAPLPAAPPIPEAGMTELQKKLAGTYNRIGGLLGTLGAEAHISPRAVVAVWQVESGGMDFVADHPILRFENHKFFDHWGQHHADRFDRHFQFGGRNGIPGKPWTQQKWRPEPTGDWRVFHGNQAKEYEVFDFARGIADDEAACLSSSFGGPQILGQNFGQLGYADAAALFQAFKQSERWHVCGFFDFCSSNGLLGHIQAEHWVPFAAGYNGGGQADSYGANIKAAFDAAAGIGL